MNRLIILITLIFYGSITYSQAPFPEPEEVDRFYKTKTLVVLEDNMFSAYNVFIK